MKRKLWISLLGILILLGLISSLVLAAQAAAAKKLAIPSISMENASGGVKISWGKVTGAAGYDVYRSVNGSSWKKVKSTTAVSYTDATAEAGKTYYYTVKAYKTVSGKKVVSACDKTQKIIRLTQPVIKLENASGGVKISWGKVTGAAGYDVYRSVNGSSWKKVKSTTAVSYTDATAEAGKTYYYTVKGYKSVGGKKIISSCDKTKKIARLTEPAIKLVNTAGGVKISWGKVTGAAGYDVYRSVNGKSWTKVKTTKDTAHTDASASFGTTYYYTVKACRTVDGRKIFSSCDKTRKILSKPIPDFKMENVFSGIKISWGKVTGAAGYDVYRSENGRSWTKVKATTGTTYTDTEAADGKTYYYTVKSYKTINGKKQISDCDKTKRIPRLTQPAFVLKNAMDGVHVQWEQVAGAAGYDVYRSVNGKSWSKVNTTAEIAWTDTAAACGELYYYTVKAYQTVDGKKFISSCDKTQSIVYLTQPAIKLENMVGSVTIRWEEADGAAEYVVCRSDDGSSWTEIKKTTEVSYTDTAVVSGKTYYYTVKACRMVDDKLFVSSGKKSAIVYLEAPAVKVENLMEDVKVRWNPVNGASGYVVYVSLDAQNWTKLADTNALNYVDKKKQTGKTYYYRVQAVCAVGNMTYCSDFKAQKIVTNTEILEGDMGIEDSIF